MPHNEPESDAGETQEFRRSRSVRRMSFLVAVATIALAVPLAFGWIGDIYQITQTPKRVDALEVEQKQIKESLDRIEGALHIQKQKPKDEQHE